MKTQLSIGKNFGGIKIAEKLRNNPGLLGSVVNEIAKLPVIDGDDAPVIPLSFEIADKIAYNDVSEYRYLIDDYALYSNYLNNVYNVMEETLPYARIKISRNINREYRRIKGELLKLKDEDETEISIIRTNSDTIITRVKDYLNDMVSRAVNLRNDIYEEDIEFALEIIIGDAFVNCKILENPNQL